MCSPTAARHCVHQMVWWGVTAQATDMIGAACWVEEQVADGWSPS